MAIDSDEALDVEKKVRAAVRETMVQLGKQPAEVSGDVDLMSAGYLDSFGFLDLVSTMEDLFGIEIDIDELDEDKMTTIDGLVGEIHRLRGAG